MANNGQNQKNEQVQQVEAKVETPVQQAAEPVVQQQAAPVEEKGGFKKWLKDHKKGVIATVIGAFTAGGSAFVAYKKGKAAGIMSVPVPEQDDYSLDPNRE